jgi:glycosyltransferase involved in cell wall biosynthesis
MSKIKVLILCHTPELYGATRSLLDVLNVLKEDPSLDIKVFVRTHGDVIQVLQDMGVSYSVTYFPLNVTFEPPSDKAAFLPAFKRNIRRIKSYIQPYRNFSRHVKAYNPNVIYTNTSIVYWGALYCLLNRCKHVWHIRELKEQFNIKHHFGIGFLQWLMKRSAAIVCNSNATATNYDLLGQPNMHVVYNGLYTQSQLQQIHASWKKKSGASLMMGIVAGLDITKGQLETLELLQAVSLPAEWKLYLIGGKGSDTDAYYNDIVAFIQKKQLQDRVIITGKVDNVSDYYQQLDLLISNSTAEAFGRVIVEAMANGVFVLARATGGIPEIVTDKQNGLLFSSEASFVEGLQWFLDNQDMPVIEEMKEQAFGSVMKRFTQEKYAAAIRQLLVA